MVEIEFIYNQQTTIIQAKPDEPLKDVINKFLQKSLLEENNVFFISNGKPINSEKTVESHMNQMNKENNKLKILAQITEGEKDEKQIFIASKAFIKFIIRTITFIFYFTLFTYNIRYIYILSTKKIFNF